MLKRIEIIAIVTIAWSSVSCDSAQKDENNENPDSTTDPSDQDTESVSDSSDADTDNDSDTDEDTDEDTNSDTFTDIDTDTESDTETDTTTESCTGEEPYCDGETAISCDDGNQVYKPCTEGTFCNFGACEISNVVLPRDAAPHGSKTEWWYYTGHVGDGTQSYGYEVTIFQYNLSVFKGYMCHVAVKYPINIFRLYVIIYFLHLHP